MTGGVQRREPRFENLHWRLLERYSPPSVLINANHDIVHLSEGAGRFLQMGGGEPSLNLMKAVHPDLRTELRTALFRAAQEGANVTAPRVPVLLNGVKRHIDLHVRCMPRPDEEGYILVLFDVLDETPGETVEVLTQTSPAAPYQEEEIQHLKEQLSATIEQYEASLEELKSSNEELQALNEELRSAAEELETSKEELQSVNEELSTVNQELKSNLDELARVNSDLQNLMASTEIGTLFLDRRLCIKRFTPRIQELFNIIPTDIGRPLSDLTHKLNYPTLAADAKLVLRDLSRLEREVSSNGKWFLVHLLPYRTLDDRIEGVVLTFIDITERKRAEAALRESEERFRALVTASSDSLYGMSADWREMRFLQGKDFIADTDNPSLSWLEKYIPPEDQPTVLNAIEEAVRSKSMFELEHRVIRKDGTLGWAHSRAVPLRNEKGEIELWFGAVRDMTARRRDEQMRLQLEREAALHEERNRMAQELHDTLAQGFTGIRMQLETAKEALHSPAADVEEGLKRVGRAIEIAQQSQAEARRTIRALRSPMLENRTLIEAFQFLAQQTGDKTEVTFRVEGAPVPLSPLVENDLYRIGQEAITNALRHSGAEEVTVLLVYEKQQILLTVEDHGKGFDSCADRAGFGITGMQERAQRQGAVLTITSQPGQGTQVRLTLPLANGQGTEGVENRAV